MPIITTNWRFMVVSQKVMPYYLESLLGGWKNITWNLYHPRKLQLTLI